jgi:hypothetical protein
VGKYGTAPQATDNTIRRMRFARGTNKATKAHSEYVTIIAFLLQQWLHERSSLLRYAFIACLYYKMFSEFHPPILST